MNLKVWLASWIEKGAVPVMTLNLQRGVPYGHPLPDAWHHQMVYGVDAEGMVFAPWLCYGFKLSNVQAYKKLQIRRCYRAVIWGYLIFTPRGFCP